MIALTFLKKELISSFCVMKHLNVDTKIFIWVFKFKRQI